MVRRLNVLLIDRLTVDMVFDETNAYEDVKQFTESYNTYASLTESLKTGS